MLRLPPLATWAVSGVFPWALCVGTLAGCENRLQATIAGVLLPECSQVEPRPDAPVVAVRMRDDDQALTWPKTGPVALAIDRDVPWRRVRPLLARGTAEAPVTPLVGIYDRVASFRLWDPPTTEPAIELRADATGKFCIRPPEWHELYCVQGSSRAVARNFVRETLRAAVKEYELTSVQVVLDEEIGWANVVRTVDGARTCCPGTTITVSPAPPEPEPDPAPAPPGAPAVAPGDVAPVDAAPAVPMPQGIPLGM